MIPTRIIQSFWVILAIPWTEGLTGQNAHQNTSNNPYQNTYQNVYNSTHQIRCEIISDCNRKKRQIDQSLLRNTWWSCPPGADRISCLQHFSRDLLSDLQRCRQCPPADLPTYLPTLRATALQQLECSREILPSCKADATNGLLDLLQNILIQKARYCRFDLELYSRYINVLHRWQQCCTNTLNTTKP